MHANDQLHTGGIAILSGCVCAVVWTPVIAGVIEGSRLLLTVGAGAMGLAVKTNKKYKTMLGQTNHKYQLILN